MMILIISYDIDHVIRRDDHLDLILRNEIIMNLLGPLSDIMTADLVTVTPDNTIQEVNKIFKDYKFHHLPVLKKGKLVGIISKSDLKLFKRGFVRNNEASRLDLFRMKTYTVGDVMTTGIAVLEPTDKVNVALEVFKENLFHAIPIVEEGHLVGMVTTFDVINNLAEDKGAVNQYKRAC